MKCICVFGLRALLVTLLLVNVVFVTARQVTDSWARLWLCMIANFVDILMVIVGLFGAAQHRIGLVIVFLVWSPFWIGWNLFVTCLYLNAGFLNRDAHWLSLLHSQQSWWAERTSESVPYWAIEATIAIIVLVESTAAAVTGCLFLRRVRRKFVHANNSPSPKLSSSRRASLRPRITMELAEKPSICPPGIANGVNGGYQSDTTGYLNASYDNSPDSQTPRRQIVYANTNGHLPSNADHFIEAIAAQSEQRRSSRHRKSNRSKRSHSSDRSRRRNADLANTNGTLTMARQVHQQTDYSAHHELASTGDLERKLNSRQSRNKSNSRHRPDERHSMYDTRTMESGLSSVSPQIAAASQQEMVSFGMNGNAGGMQQQSDAYRSFKDLRAEILAAQQAGELRPKREDRRRRSYEKNKSKQLRHHRRTNSVDRGSSASSLASALDQNNDVEANPDPSCSTFSPRFFGTGASNSSLMRKASNGSNRSKLVEIPKPPLHGGMRPLYAVVPNRTGASASVNYEDEPRRISMHGNQAHGENSDAAKVRRSSNTSSPPPTSFVSFDPKSDTIVRYFNNNQAINDTDGTSNNFVPIRFPAGNEIEHHLSSKPASSVLSADSGFPQTSLSLRNTSSLLSNTQSELVNEERRLANSLVRAENGHIIACPEQPPHSFLPKQQQFAASSVLQQQHQPISAFRPTAANMNGKLQNSEDDSDGWSTSSQGTADNQLQTGISFPPDYYAEQNTQPQVLPSAMYHQNQLPSSSSAATNGYVDHGNARQGVSRQHPHPTLVQPNLPVYPSSRPLSSSTDTRVSASSSLASFLAKYNAPDPELEEMAQMAIDASPLVSSALNFQKKPASVASAKNGAVTSTAQQSNGVVYGSASTYGLTGQLAFENNKALPYANGIAKPQTATNAKFAPASSSSGHYANSSGSGNYYVRGASKQHSAGLANGHVPNGVIDRAREYSEISIGEDAQGQQQQYLPVKSMANGNCVPLLFNEKSLLV